MLDHQIQTVAEVLHFCLNCFPVCVHVLAGVVIDFSSVEAVVISETVLVLAQFQNCSASNMQNAL